MTFLEAHKDEIFKKYNKEELIQDINSYKTGNGKLQKVLNHFFEECIFNSCGKKTVISPMDVLKSEQLTEKAFNYIKTKPKFFTGTDIQNIKSFFRNSASWVRKVANFPPKEARNIYFRYNDINGNIINILDTSMGFGSRMSAVLLSGHNYCGFDPNRDLFEKLKQYLKFLRDNELIKKEQKCGLYCCGSELYKPELNNKFDVSFTSPPYFNLEKYSDDTCESTKNYDNYELWVNNFVIPTVKNTYKYLKIGGHAMINIKNISSKECCFDSFYKAFLNISGFEFVEIFDLQIESKKQYGMANGKGNITPKEPIMVFKKIS